MLHARAEAAPTPELEVRVGTTVIANGGFVDLGTTSPGTPFIVALTFANEGPDGSVLHVTNFLLSGGLSIADPLPAGINDGEAHPLRIQCDATQNVYGTLAFTTDDPDESYNEIDLACSIDSSGAPGLRVLDFNGDQVPNDGEVWVAPGGVASLTIFNDQGGSQPVKFATPTSNVPGPTFSGFQPDIVLAADGLPVNVSVWCEDSQEQPSIGVFTITLPDVLNETNFVFTLHCQVQEDSDSSGLPPTGRSSTPWIAFTAVGLVLAGYVLRSTARTRHEVFSD